MGYIQKFFQSKKIVEKFIEEHGMEKAVAEYGIEKLLMYKLLLQYEGTNLFYDDDRSFVTQVFNKEGKILGEITQLMSPYYKKLGHHFGPCLNGNIILSEKNKDRQGKTFAVYNKDGKVIIPYGKYNEYEFLPNGVALMSCFDAEKEDLVTIHFDGTVKVQPFTYIEKIISSDEYELHTRNGETVKVYYAKESVVNNIMDKSTEIGTIEKGIE